MRQRGESSVGVALFAVAALVAGGLALVGATVRQNRSDEAALRAYSTRLDAALSAAVLGRPYSFLHVNDDGSPARWNPCEPIHYVVNLSAAPPGAFDDVTEAVARVGAATGVEFILDGETTEPLRAARPGYQPSAYGDRWAPVLIGWVPLDATDIPHRDDTVGVASPFAVGVGPGNLAIVSGQIALEATRPLTPGFDTKDSWGGVVMHELGHLLGLGHVGDPFQLMDGGGVAAGGPAEWGDGDLAGLRLVGREAGCRRTPRAGPS